MRSLFSMRRKKAGLPPGTLVPVGEPGVETTTLRRYSYDEEGVEETEARAPSELLPLPEGRRHWVHVQGSHDVETVRGLGEGLGLHPLLLEDVLHAGQRAKAEEYEGALFLVLKAPRVFGEAGEVGFEQVSVVLLPGAVLSFQESDRPLFRPNAERLARGRGRIRRAGPDYLAYTLVDTVVDEGFAVLERFGAALEELEGELLDSPTLETLHDLQKLRRDLLFFRKLCWPLREALRSLTRGDFDLVDEATLPYFRDVHDHAVQILDTVETYREFLGGLLDIYLSSVSNRMNEVMKVLTIIATLFIPLTFLAGIYGMNFRYMPELDWKGGYFAVLGLMAVLAAAMAVWFRRKRWL